MKLHLTIETHPVEGSKLMEIHEVVETVACELLDCYGDDFGTIEGEIANIDWRIEEVHHGAEIDRRQRVAAANLLMGFDLPQPVEAFAASMLEAALICPGLTTGELPDASKGARRLALQNARRIIDEMLAE